MIYEVTPSQPIDVGTLLRLSNELEAERDAARATIRQEIRDRHDATLTLIGLYVIADNRAAYDLLHRAAAKLEAYTDCMFTVLEVL
jgi:3-deoxy-D-arabino-heptulosonate 7-phosphate (DAHP) synthase